MHKGVSTRKRGRPVSKQSTNEQPTETSNFTTFIYIVCPNCTDERYRMKSMGGWSRFGNFAQIEPLCLMEPLCLICNGVGRLVICYSCNAVQKYSRSDPPQCDGCHKTLTMCAQHKWKTSGAGKFICSICDTIGTAVPAVEVPCALTKHEWSVQEDNTVRCSKCHKLAEIK